MPVNADNIQNIAMAGDSTPLGIEREEGNKGAVTGIVQCAEIPFKGKVLQFLASVPLLKGLPVVGAYVKETRMSNQLLLTQFISSLSDTVSETKLKAAQEALHIKDGKPLTGRDFKIMTDRIANFDGIGKAQVMPRRVQINVWPYETINHPGHASMTIKNDNHDTGEIHISWGPDTGRSGGLYDRYFANDKSLKSDSYDSDAVDAISEGSVERLQSFDEIREIQQNEGSLNKAISSAINDQAKKIYQTARKNFAVQIKNNSAFSSMEPVKQQELLTQLITEEIICSDSHSAAPRGIIESHQKALMTKISPVIVNIMFDVAVNIAQEENFAAIFTGRISQNFLDRLNQTIRADKEIGMNREVTMQLILKEAPYFMPRARQTKDNYQNWIVNAEKIFLPLRGEQGQEAFALFGLDEEAIHRHWADIQQRAENNEIGYRFISKDKNCSGIVAGVLCAGGADDFAPFKSSLFVQTPNDVYRYALAVQSRVDRLNQQNAEIKAFYQREQQNRQLELNGRPVMDASVTTLRDSFNQILNDEMTSAENKLFSSLERAVDTIPAERAGKKALTKAGISLVETVSDLLNNPLSLPQNEAASRALFMAAAMRESLEKMMKNTLAAGTE